METNLVHDTVAVATATTDEPAAAPAADPTPVPVRKPRGFAAMDRAKLSEIARKGGKAAHAAGTAHEFNTDEAREAGRKGGHATSAKRVAREPAAG